MLLRSPSGSLAVFVTGFVLALLPSALAAQTAPLFEPPDVAPGYPALHTDDPPVIDGRLDEPLWQTAVPLTEFRQREPTQGAPPGFHTEIRFAFDGEALYVAARCDQPASTVRVQNLQRDFDPEQNDRLSFAIDAFLDQRNAVVFEVTPWGSQRDLEVLDGSRENVDWNVRWQVRTRIDENGWQAELAIPWRNLRYRPDTGELGLLVSRNIRHRNEQVSSPLVPRVLSSYRMAYAARLTGLTVPAPSRNVALNPYLLTQRVDRDGEPKDDDVEVGGELKWAISPGTVLDLTVNTDFAQAEVDRQAVNLDRFSVFFPERRQFFLESANLFDASVTSWIQPFFSRRIGLDDQGQPIPLAGGARLTARSSRQEFGALAMRQERLGASPAATFGVARYARNLGDQSRLGGMATFRRDEALGDLPGNDNTTLTVDGTWQPNQTFGLQAMISGSRDDVTGNGLSGQLWMYYETNQVYAGLLEYYNRDYDPGVGLEILDTNYVMHSPALKFDLRPDALPGFVRSFEPGFEAYLFRSSDDGDLLFAYAPISPVKFTFEDGGTAELFIEPNWQRLEEPFFPAGIEIAPGDYDYTRYGLSGASDPSKAWSFSGTVESGAYFDGDLTSYQATGRFAPSPRIEVSFEAELNQLRNVGIGAVDRNTRLYSADLTYAWNPQLEVSLFAQHNSLAERTTWNARLQWEFRPLSYLYLVYGGDRDTSELDPTTRLRDQGQQLIVKFTYLLEL